MKAVSVARLTMAVCLSAAVLEAVLGGTSTSRLSLMDIPVFLFIVGPYLCLGMMSWLQRGKPVASWILLAIAVGLSTWGLLMFGADSYRYHTEPDYGKLQRLAVFFVPLVQYAAVLLVCLGVLVQYLSSRNAGTPDEAA